MDFTRTTTVNDTTILSAMRGIQPATCGCIGPYTSKDRGMDTMCCARCSVLRQQLYRVVGMFILNSLSNNYLNKLVERISSVKDIMSCCIVSTCGIQDEKASPNMRIPLIYIPPSTNVLVSENVLWFLREQMLLWREMNISADITTNLIAYTRSGLPVVLPGNKAVEVERKMNDDGVEFMKDNQMFIRVVDPAKALGGKWCHVVNYQKVLGLLYPSETIGRREINGSVWYETF